MKIGIVIVSCEHPELLKPCLESIFAEPPEGDSNIYMVDNGSKNTELNDYYIDLEANWNDIKIMRMGENLGCPAALNVGFRQAIKDGCDMIFRMDNDTVVTQGALAECAEIAMERMAIVSPATNSATPGSGQEIPVDSEDKPLHPDVYKYGTVVESRAVTGFCNAIPAKIWQDVGGFIEEDHEGKRLMVFAEDTIFCVAAGKKGYKCLVAKHAFVQHIHKGSADLGDFAARSKRADEFFRHWMKENQE